MAITESTIQEFRQVMKEDYGKELTRAEAIEMLRSMVGYFDLLAKIQSRVQEQKI